MYPANVGSGFHRGRRRGGLFSGSQQVDPDVSDDRKREAFLVAHCVDRTVNLTPLPCEQRRGSVRGAYEHLEPGETMQVIDDFRPEWVREFLQDQFDMTLPREAFWIEETAGRYVMYVQKPEEGNDVETRNSTTKPRST